MASLEEALGRRGDGPKSFLVNGGCNRRGVCAPGRWAELEALARCGVRLTSIRLVDMEDTRAIGLPAWSL